jgi:hypothetical protein
VPSKKPSFWLTIPGILAQIAAVITAVGTIVAGVRQCQKIRQSPGYDAWMEVEPSPIVHGEPASIQFYFNNSSDVRVRLLRMIAYDACGGSEAPIEMTPGFPGWKASIVEPHSPKHNFYSAQHSHFAVSCGASAGEWDHLYYKFDLVFDPGDGLAQRTVSFEKNISVMPEQKAFRAGTPTLRESPSPNSK